MNFFFMEMNTRLQVEHPVTEAVTGLDLVEWQLHVAAGERLPLAQEAIRQHGHAIEARIYSEDPRRGFLPSVGRVRRFAHPPEAADWRIDTGIADGDEVTVHYDPMIAKVIAAGPDRASALATLKHNLDRTAVFGVANNLPLLRAITAHPAFAAGDVDTGFVDRELAVLTADRAPRPEALLLASRLALEERQPAQADVASPWSRGDGWRSSAPAEQLIGLRTPEHRRWQVQANGDSLEVASQDQRLTGRVQRLAASRFAVDAGRGPRELELIRDRDGLQVIGDAADEITLAPAWPFERSLEDADAHPASPLPGRVVELRVKVGDAVERGDVLAVVEGMKMQHAIRTGRAGRVANVLARAGELVDAETVLFDIDPG
jgi:3-methylcrotonyl-CoA carboxylase alpha subunit